MSETQSHRPQLEHHSSQDTLQQLQTDLATHGISYKQGALSAAETEQLSKHAQDCLLDAETIVAVYNQDTFLGFVDLSVDHDHKTATVQMRYVVDALQNKGYGKELRKVVYLWCLENCIDTIRSTINNVLKLNADGVITSDVTTREGSWKSYSSLVQAQLTDTSTFPTELTAVTLHYVGPHVAIGVDLQTSLNRADSHTTLPTTPEGLFLYLKTDILPIPDHVTNQVIFNLAKENITIHSEKGSNSI